MPSRLPQFIGPRDKRPTLVVTTPYAISDSSRKVLVEAHKRDYPGHKIVVWDRWGIAIGPHLNMELHHA